MDWRSKAQKHDESTPNLLPHRNTGPAISQVAEALPQCDQGIGGQSCNQDSASGAA